MGPLPQLYRHLVAGLVLVLSLGTGVWLAGRLELPLGGIGVGLVVGCLLAFVLTHDFHRAFHRERRTRVTRRR